MAVPGDDKRTMKDRKKQFKGEIDRVRHGRPLILSHMRIKKNRKHLLE